MWQLDGRVLLTFALCALMRQSSAKVPLDRTTSFSNDTSGNSHTQAVATTPSDFESADDAENSEDEIDDESSGGDGIDNVNAVARTRPENLTDSQWSRWDFKQRREFWERQCGEEVKKVVKDLNDVVSKAKQEKVNDRKIEVLKPLIKTFGEAGTQIEEGTLTEKFKVPTNVKEDIEKQIKKIEADVTKVKERSTRISEQKAERALAAVKSIGEGVKKLKANWGKEGKEWEMVSDLSSMLSGVLAVIPSPHTKTLAVFLDVASSLIGIFSPAETKEDAVKIYIDEAVEKILKFQQEDRKTINKAEIASLSKKWKYSVQKIIEPITDGNHWDRLLNNGLVPKADAFDKTSETAADWVQRNLKIGADGEITKVLILQYFRICKLIDQLYTRNIRLMPQFNQKWKDIRDGYTMSLQAIQRRTYNLIMNQILVVDRHSAITLFQIYPPGINTESTEIFEYVSGFSFAYGQEVTMVTGIPQPLKGKFRLESAEKPGWFVTLASDNDVQQVAEARYIKHLQISYNSYLPHKWEGDQIYPHDLGVEVTLAKDAKDNIINIDEPNDKSETARTLTFEKNKGEIKYLMSFQAQTYTNEITKYVAHGPHTTADMPIFAPTAKKPTEKSNRIITNGLWRIIEMKREKGDPGIPVMIGDAGGTSFLQIGDSQLTSSHWPIYLKPLNPEKKGDNQMVPKKNIFYLHARNYIDTLDFSIFG